MSPNDAPEYPEAGGDEPEVPCLALGCFLMLLSAIATLYGLLELLRAFRR